MKLRWKSDSLRFRIKPGEVEPPMSLSITWRARLLSGLLTALTLITLVLLAQGRIRAVLSGAVDTALREQAEGLLRDPRFAQGPLRFPPMTPT